MIVKASKISLRVRIQSLLQKPADHISLDVKRSRGDIHHVIETAVELFLIFGLICDTRHIDGDNADRSGALAGTKESAGFLSKLTQIQAETAAHGAHVAWFHIAVDVVGKIRSTVLGSHLKEKSVILGIGPVKFLCDGISRDRILESTSVGISLDHGLDERFVDHINLFFTVFVLEVHLLAADDRRKLCEVIRYGPVECNVGERCLASPAARCVHPIYKRFNTFLHFRIRKVVHLYKRSQIGIKG